MTKQQARTRRSLKTKALIRKSNRLRLVVYRSSCHIYAQVIKQESKGDEVIVACSTLDKTLRAQLTGKKKAEQAYEVGKMLAERAKEKNVLDVAFDRAGYKYHGRIKALAEGAREAGLNF
ncbi:MAG: 50S ribosomal protein L18 [Legionellaceae bacterium]